MRKCTKCGSSGPFYSDKRASDGCSSWCKKCMAQSSHDRYMRNRVADMARIKRWQQAHPDRVKRYKEKNNSHNKNRGAIWYWNNVEYARAKHLKRAKENPEQQAAHKHAYRTRQTEAGGSYTVDEWNNLCRQYDYCCAACGQRKPLAADHVIPVAKGGTSNIDNIQPLCKSCNSSKGTKIIDYRKEAPPPEFVQLGIFESFLDEEDKGD